MGNILFTTYCNRSCSYCFAKAKIDLDKEQDDSAKNMSMEALERVIKYYQKSQLQRFSILGGEPTLHPNFNQMVDRVLAEQEFTSVMIFSNGLIPKNALEFLANHRDPRLKVALNLNPPEEHTSSQLAWVCNTMEKLGRRIGLGLNIYRPGQRYGYLIDAIEQFNLSRHIRIGLTHPILGTDNVYACDRDIPHIANDLMLFAQTVYDKGINFSFDCGFQFCMFTIEQHKELLRLGIKFKSRCSPIIDIGPDLSIWRCFPLNRYIYGNLTESVTRNKLINFYDQKFNNYFPMGNKLECPDCRYRVNQLCNGGCLARTLIAFQSQTEIIKKDGTS